MSQDRLSTDRKDAYTTGYPRLEDHIPQLLALGKSSGYIATLLSTPLCSLGDIDRDTLVINIPPITTTRGQNIAHHNDIQCYVEKPLLQAVQLLWDNNIQTRGSSANCKNVGNKSHISIKADTLSDENKAILLSHGGQESEGLIEISMPVGLNTKFADVEDCFLAIVSQLRKQPLMWGYLRLSLHSMIFNHPLYDRKYDKKFFSEELKSKANDSSIVSATEESLKKMFGMYSDDDIRECMEKVYTAGQFFSDDFIKWVNILGFDGFYKECKAEIESRNS